MKTIKELPTPLRLDLACGAEKQEGFIGVDIADIPETDIQWDLDNYPWPFEDDSVSEIHCQHFVEHVGDLMKFMNECHRIMKPGAEFKIIAPYYTSIRAWQDPTHVRAISEGSFMYYNENWRRINHLAHYPITANFEVSYTYGIDKEWTSIWEYMDEYSRAYAIRHYNNVVSDIVVFLTKVDNTKEDKKD